jgi:hypothetical protein
LWQLEEIRQKRAAERMQHAPPTAASHVDPYGWYILLSVAYFLITHFDLLLICFTYMLTLTCIFRSLDGCIDGDDLKGIKELELRSV